MPEAIPAQKCGDCGQVIPADTPGGHCPHCLSALAASFAMRGPRPAPDGGEFEEGAQIGPYRLVRRLGEGGFGYVYLAEQEEPFRRQVALKILKPGMDSRRIIARFAAERQALALMDHPNISRIIDADATGGGRPYFAMELVEGGVPITRYCQQHNLSSAEMLTLFESVCAAVGHAHRKGIIHRDLKPSNVLVASSEQGEHLAKVIDFGIAKAFEQPLGDDTLFTRENQIIGTPAYISPEQAQMGPGAQVDTRADIYSLGVILYELLTGQPPFPQETLSSLPYDEALHMLRETDPPRPSSSEPGTPKDLDWVTMKALEKKPDRRYETADALARDLARHLAHEPVEAGPPGRVYQLRKFVRRHRIGVSAACIVALALVAATVISTIMFFKARNSEASARSSETESRQTSSRSEFLMACELARADHQPAAVAHLCRALRIDPQNRRAAFKLAATLAYENFALLALPTFEHPNKVRGVAFNSGGTRLATTCADGVARLWDLSSGDLLLASGEPANLWENPVLASPDGNRFVTSLRPGVAVVRDFESGEVLIPELPHQGLLSWVAWSSDGRRLAIFAGKTVTVWDSSTGSLISSCPRHPLAGVHGDLSPDGRVVATSADRSVRLYDAGTGRAVGEEMPVSGGPSRIQFTADGRRLMVASWRGRIARLWDVASREPLVDPISHSLAVSDAVISPKGGTFATACRDRLARLWDLNSGDLIGVMQHPSRVQTLRFGAGGDILATGCESLSSGGATVRVWDAQTCEPIMVSLHHGYSVFHLELSADGTQMATGSPDGTVKVWDIRYRGARELRIEHPTWVWHADFRDGGSRIVTWSAGGLARHWSTATGERLRSTMASDEKNEGLGSDLRHARAQYYWGEDAGSLLRPSMRVGGVATIAQSPRGGLVATGGIDGRVRLWDLRSGELAISPLEHGDVPLTVLTFSGDGARLASADENGKLRVWDVQDGRALGDVAAHEAAVLSASFADGSASIISGAIDGSVAICEFGEVGELRLHRRIQAHSAGVTQLAIDRTRARFATGSTDNSARVWDLSSAEAVTPRLVHLASVGGWGVHVGFSPDGEKLVTAGSYDRSAHVWDSTSGRQLVAPLEHPTAVLAFDLSASGELLATACDDGGVRVWDLESGEQLTPVLRHGNKELNGDRVKVVGVQFSRDGRRLLSHGRDGSARVWDLPVMGEPLPAWFLDLGEAIAGARIDETGILERLGHEELRQVRAEVDALAGGNGMVGWGKWLAADPDSRPPSPLRRPELAD